MNKDLGMAKNNSNLVGGLVLMGIGAWFLLRNMIPALPGMDAFWPIFPVLVGLSFLVGYVRSREAGLLIPGVSSLLIGLFFFAFSLHMVSWSAMGVLWPIFPLIGGVAFAATFVATGAQEWGLLVPAGAGLAVGFFGLVLGFGGSGLLTLINFWPVLLILAGLAVLAQNMLNRQQ